MNTGHTSNLRLEHEIRATRNAGAMEAIRMLHVNNHMDDLLREAAEERLAARVAAVARPKETAGLGLRRRFGRALVALGRTIEGARATAG